MLKVIELFGGIGACTQALKRIGIDFKVVDYVEIDKYAVASYNAMNNTNFETQDICEWNKDIEADLIMHGSPCQDFSIAGKQAGGDEGSGTRSSLMYETIRIVEKLKPKYVIWENVKNLLSKKHKHNFDAYLTKMRFLGYYSYYKILNAKDYGIPQNRERVYTISIRKDIDNGSFKFPEKEELKLKLKDMLEEEVDEKYYLSETGIEYFKEQAKNRNDNLEKYDTRKIIKVAHGYNQGSVNDLDICPTLDINFSQFWRGVILEPKLLIKNATKKGYLEACEGDSINLAYPNSKTRRGRVGKEVSQTLQCNDSMGVIVIGNYMPSNHEASRIVDKEGIAPTVKENHGTVTPIVENKTIEQLEHKEMLEDDIETLENEISYRNETKDSNLRIRKLTPKECWRLMGFKDEEFEKAQKVNSNAQLYKQAGNSIVVDVLEKIFRNLLKE